MSDDDSPTRRVDQRIKPSAFGNLLGFRVTVTGAGTAVAELALEDKHMNRSDIPHGGVTTSLMDVAMGSAVNTPAPVITVSMTVNFLRASRGKQLRAEARQTGGGVSVAYCEAKLIDDTGALCATSTGVFKIMRPRKA